MNSRIFSVAAFVLLTSSVAIAADAPKATVPAKPAKTSVSKAPLFKLDGKTYKQADFSTELSKALSEVDSQAAQGRHSVVEGAALSTYIDREGDKQKLSRQQLEDKMYPVKEPSDDEAKAFYDKNKEHIQGSFDEIKAKLKPYMMSQAMIENRRAYLEKMVKNGQIVYLDKDPNSATLFKLDGKIYKAADLSNNMKQAMYDADAGVYQRRHGILEAAAVNAYLDSEAKKQKKTRQQIEDAEIGGKTPTDDEVKAFYEQNKANIAAPFDQMKEKIKSFMTSQAGGEKRKALLDKLTKSHRLTFEDHEPKAPFIKVNTDGFQVKGNPKAKVQVVEFADYQCPHCKHASEGLKQLTDKYGDKIGFVYIDFPINPSGISTLVAQGAYCAVSQGKYWEYHDLAFSKPTLTSESPLDLAKELKLDEGQFKQCFSTTTAADYVKKGKNEGDRVGVSGTPTIFINGRRISGNNSFESISKEVDTLL